ncbi:MAG: M36 family metallopeptidase, partial [Flavobacteriales bacterium]
TGVDSSLVVNSPASVDGPYANVLAGFGPSLPSVPITADVVLVQDDVSPASDGCDSITNGADLVGKIALVDRGICTFISKVQALQDAGAVAVIVINNQSGAPFAMSGTTGDITIPAVMISQGNGVGFKNALQFGPVNATIQGHNALFDKDGDFDNGVIAHEYGHGVSTRLTGGPANSDCLWNDEQMGEGWSDWMALLVTMKPGDHGSDARGIGTYVVEEPTTGQGIRLAPYSTDLSVNNYTYGDLNNQNLIYEEHDIGFLWATMTWDMTWALVNAHGFSADMYHGNGGNNIAMRLMIDGLKLQPCNPGFVDGRNAILQADTLDFGGADACLIWNAFARRGLGYSADEGSSFSRFDQTQAFDLPPGCDNILSVGEHQGEQADFVSLVPNPAQELVTIGLRMPLKDDLIVTVYSAEGRSVLNGAMRAGSTTLKLDITALAPGSYQVDLRGAGSAWHRSLIVVR